MQLSAGLQTGNDAGSKSAQGKVEDIVPVQSSLWLCKATVVIPEEHNRAVYIDVPCMNRGDAIGRKLDICYQHDDPVKATARLPAFFKPGSGTTMGDEVAYDMSCRDDTRSSYKWCVRGAWICFSAVLASLIPQVIAFFKRD